MLLVKSLSLAKSLSKMKMQDTILTGIIGGLIGTICMDTTNTLIYKARKTETLYGHIAGQFFVSAFRTNTTKNFVLGELLHLAVGGFFGIPTMLTLKLTGKDHYWLKGLGTSMFTWGILYTGGQKVGLFKKLRLTKTHYSALFNNTVYGLASSFAMVKLADQNIFAAAEKRKGQTINRGQAAHKTTLVRPQDLAQEQPSEQPVQ